MNNFKGLWNLLNSFCLFYFFLFCLAFLKALGIIVELILYHVMESEDFLRRTIDRGGHQGGHCSYQRKNHRRLQHRPEVGTDFMLVNLCNPDILQHLYPQHPCLPMLLSQRLSCVSLMQSLVSFNTWHRIYNHKAATSLWLCSIWMCLVLVVGLVMVVVIAGKPRLNMTLNIFHVKQYAVST